MASYQSAYSGAEIDTAVQKINSIDYTPTEINTALAKIPELEDKTSLIEFPAGSGKRVINLGELIIQTANITLAYNAVEVRNFPTAFPTECLFIIVQGTHMDASSGYSAPNSIQCQILSASQYRTYMNNTTVANATMSAKMIAIGC